MARPDSGTTCRLICCSYDHCDQPVPAVRLTCQGCGPTLRVRTSSIRTAKPLLRWLFPFSRAAKSWINATKSAQPSWTADYLAVRALHDRDTFPAGDLVLRRAVQVSTAKDAALAAAPWRPSRAYALFNLWTQRVYSTEPPLPVR